MHGNPRFWAYPKMMIAKHLSVDFDKFCMLDTDLYIKSREFFDVDARILAYHLEETDKAKHPESPYLDGEFMFKLAELENPIKTWKNFATNTAILYLNGVADFIHEWMYHVDAIVENSYKWEPSPGAGDQIFVEQYLLPNLANELGVEIKTYLNSSWIPGPKADVMHTDINMFGWIHNEPLEEVQRKFKNVFHIWGLKHSLNYAIVRQEVLGRILKDLDEDFPNLDESYPVLLAEARELYKDQNDYYLGTLDSDKPKERKNGKSKKHRPTTS
jgi:hypothetical protein